MAKERLSKMQKAVLAVLSGKECHKYPELKQETAKKLGQWIYHTWVNSWGDHMGKWDYSNPDSYNASFARSLKGLEKKGLVERYQFFRRIPVSHRLHGSSCNIRFRMTDEGLNVKSSQFNIKEG